jgi:hypothetical protein
VCAQKWRQKEIQITDHYQLSRRFSASASPFDPHRKQTIRLSSAQRLFHRSDAIAGIDSGTNCIPKKKNFHYGVIKAGKT